jgi:hypothetical protein
MENLVRIAIGVLFILLVLLSLTVTDAACSSGCHKGQRKLVLLFFVFAPSVLAAVIVWICGKQFIRKSDHTGGRRHG